MPLRSFGAQVSEFRRSAACGSSAMPSAKLAAFRESAVGFYRGFNWNRAGLCVRVSMHACMYDLCMHMYVHVYIHTFICIYTYIHI